MLMFCSVLLVAAAKDKQPGMHGSWYYGNDPVFVYEAICMPNSHATADFRAKHTAAESGVLPREKACCFCCTTDVRSLNPVFPSS